jgi:phosphotransferase system HPr (HPr) family protein
MAESSVYKTVTVINRQGIHARPAHALATLAGSFQANIEIVREGVIADAKSILAIMTLAAERGTELLLRATGDDAQQAIAALEQLILTGFGEDEDKNQEAGEHATD